MDRKLTFIPQVVKTYIKATHIYKGLVRAAKATWSLSSDVVRTIYVAVIEPIVLKASCAWAPATGKFGVRKMFNAVQRSVTLKACWPHRAVSLHYVLILSKLFLLDIKELEKPVYFGDLPHPTHLPEIGYESIEYLKFQTMDHLAMAMDTHLYRRKPHRRQSRCGPDGMAGRRGNLVLDTPTRSLLHGLPSGDGRAAKSDTEGRAVHPFWVREHTGIEGNEHDAAKIQNVLTRSWEYDMFLLEHVTLEAKINVRKCRLATSCEVALPGNYRG
ncbi:hypothetical protein EVAR_34273_1 [Eumeta japonica]|uniref:115 kDa protein in type-1 retrotransposable element R1DM n=1 Tax=Eumeta variegata TaxID=151549 RepID=A0A4C1VZU7_EUMVA|nr:hypothetical protein EVAR_34273_1 [Eumeta japonica]